MDDSPLEITIQSGGKLIGQGTYGCVYDPPLLTFNKRGATSRNKLGKVVHVSDLELEIGIAKVLREFPDAEKYCIIPEVDTLSKPLPSSKQTEKDLRKCISLRRFGQGSMYQYELRYGGIPLKTFIESPSYSIAKFPFFIFMRELLEIGVFMLLHGCIHNDLHASNIVMNPKNGANPRLIDFGRSYTHRGINRELIEKLRAHYDAGIHQITPECSAQFGLQEGISFNQILSDLNTKKAGIRFGEMILGTSRKQQLTEFATFWKSSISASSGDWPTFYSYYWHVVDSWAIGTILLSILRRLFLLKEFLQSQEWKEKGALVKEILRGLLRASPRDRSDCLEALSIYDPTNHFVTGEAGKAWLESK
jgi:serine/threonine protein kinase